MRPVGSQTVAKSAEQDAPRTTYALLLLRGCGAFLAVITFSFFIYIYIHTHTHAQCACMAKDPGASSKVAECLVPVCASWSQALEAEHF